MYLLFDDQCCITNNQQPTLFVFEYRFKDTLQVYKDGLVRVYHPWSGSYLFHLTEVLQLQLLYATLRDHLHNPDNTLRLFELEVE